MMSHSSSKMNNSKMKYTGQSFRSQATETGYSTASSTTGGERVRVAVRIRPLQPHELGRNDNTIVSAAD